MLSRTADSLYWMARYVERAENMARIIDVTHRMSLAPNASSTAGRLWEPVMAIAGDREDFSLRYDAPTPANVLRFLILDPENPSSIMSSIRVARENARAVRGAITSEMWESLNQTWLEIKTAGEERLANNELSGFCEWVKSRSHLFRGVTFGTMLQDDAFRFLRLGTLIERADNTARILDVKYHVLLPSPDQVGGALDYYEWGAVLHSVAAFESYHKVFRESISPWRVAELLVLRHDMPRSLHGCMDQALVILERLSAGGCESHRLAGQMHARLHYGRMDVIFQEGLHEFLEDFTEQNDELGLQIHHNFLSLSD